MLTAQEAAQLPGAQVETIRRMARREGIWAYKIGLSFEPELLHAAGFTGMTTVINDSVKKIQNGTTTCEEVQRVFGPRNTVEISCVHCGAVMTQRHPFCPFCGTELIRLCKGCGHLLVSGWHFCPLAVLTREPSTRIITIVRSENRANARFNEFERHVGACEGLQDVP